ncbi:hypothetical protein MD484_g632, partial [Candolleomyces efflorescens]
MEMHDTIGEMDGLPKIDGLRINIDEGHRPQGRISESASTVRALPAHILAELERIHHIQQQSSDSDSTEGGQNLENGEEAEEEDGEGSSLDTSRVGSDGGGTPPGGQTTQAEEGTPLNTSSMQQPQPPNPTPDRSAVPAAALSPAPAPFLMPRSLEASHSTNFSFPSMPPSPRLDGADSSALPSPSESVSSLPSVGSSFFFSSAAASPGFPSRSLSHLEHEHEFQEHAQDGQHRMGSRTTSQEGQQRREQDAQDSSGQDKSGSRSGHQNHRRRRTLRQQRSESTFSSLESSPSSLELIFGGRASSRSRRGAGGVGRRRSFGQPHYTYSSDNAGATSGLIIPSLSLPPALKRPTPFGQTMGEMRLLVLARQGAAPGGRGFLTTLLLEDNEEIVEVGEWEDPIPVEVLAAKQGSHDGDGAEQDLLDGLDEDMVQLGRAGAKVLRASTDWIEHNDAHGLEKFEPMRNVEVVELPGYDALTDGDALVTKIKNIVHAPFHAVSDVLHPESQPSAVLANLVGSASTPLFTGLILLLPSGKQPINGVISSHRAHIVDSALTPLDRHIVDSLGAHIPIIVLPGSAASNASTSSSYPVSSSSSFSASFPASRDSPIQTQPNQQQSHNTVPAYPEISSSVRKALTAAPLVLSSFRPRNAVALKNGLFHSPETLATLRMEAAGRFLRWREVERVVRGLHGGDSTTTLYSSSYTRGLSKERGSRKRAGDERAQIGWRGWDKEKWERDWMTDFSRDVAVGVKERSMLLGEGTHSGEEDQQEDGVRSDAEGTLAEGNEEGDELDEKHAAPRIIAYAHSHSFDPLHFPSLFLFTMSMLGPLKSRVVEAVKRICLMPFAMVFGPAGVVTPLPPAASRNRVRGSDTTATQQEFDEKNAGQLVQGNIQFQGQTQKWVVVGGLVGASFCVGVGVGVVVAGGGD